MMHPGIAGRRPWQRFPGDVESRYQAWAIDQMRPLALLVGILGAVTWLVMPIHTMLVLGETPRGSIVLEAVYGPALEVAWIVLLLHRWTRPATVAWNALAVLASFALTTYLVRGVYGVTSSGVVYTAIFYCFFMQLLRTPFRTAALVSATVSGVAAVILSVDIRAGHLSLYEAYPAFTELAVVAFMSTAAALLLEHSGRESWVQARLLEQQQDQLSESRRLIRRYVPPTVAEQIELGHGYRIDTPVRRRVTVMFSDVVGFTSMADRLDPESLTEVINDYLGEVSDVVDRHGGTLNEFAGDGFMAIFGAPQEMDPEDQVVAALAASRAVHTRLPELHRRWERLGVDHPVQTRVGINTGVLSVGTFGSAGRATYTAIGLQTNIAARIQAECRPGGILLSQGSWNLVKHREQGEYRGEVEVKGVHFPIGLYEPGAPASDVSTST